MVSQPEIDLIFLPQIAPGWTGMRTPVPGLASSGAQSGCLSEAHTWSTVVTLYVYVSGSRWLTHATWLR